jgi:hypothetical protein
MQVKIFTMMCLWIGSVMSLQSQSVLNELVSLDFNQAKIKTVFKSIHEQSGAIFSYSDFNDDQIVTILAVKKPLKDVVTILEEQLNVSITAKDRYLIVKNNFVPTIKDVSIQGTIISPNSDEPLSDASVYVRKHKILVNTARDGSFAFKVPKESKKIQINVAKANYIDTTLVIVVSKNQNVNIRMRSFPRQKVSDFDSLTKKELFLSSVSDREPLSIPEVKTMTYNESFWEKQKKKNINLININDTLLNRFSVSLLPPISTNKLLAYHTKNSISINIIGGHSKGLDGLEIGGVYNYVDGNVYGVQTAGVMNLVSDNVIGTQVGGVFNGVRGHVKGVQIAGVANLNDKSTTGIQVAGVFQSTSALRGLQISGLYNSAKTVKGGQISGLINVVDSASTYLQVAGIFNKAANIEGLQISGLVNSCDTLVGIQIGIFNRSNHIKKGLSIGLVNYVKNGYNKLEVAYNELGTVSLGYRSGWAPLHFHYFGGMNLKDKEFRFAQLGIGLASSIPLSKKIHFQADANVRNTHDVDNITDWHFNMYNQLFLGLSWQPAKKFGLRSGLTFNHLWYDPASTLHSFVASMPKNPIYTEMNSSHHHKIWIGWQVGVVLF